MDHHRKIEKEIGALGPSHAWAGNYYFGDGLGVNKTLSIAPDNGFTFQWRGCLGVYDRNLGAVVQTNEGTLRLVFELPHKSVMLASEFIPIKWGDRRYLVSVERSVQFCSRNNKGREPRDGIHGFYFLHFCDAGKPVQDAPTMPSAYQPFLRDKPIDAKIVTVFESKIGRDSDGLAKHTTVIRLDVGQEDNVVGGMHFRLLNPDDDLNCLGARIVTVGKNTATAMLTQIATERITPAKPQLGWKLTTGARYTETERCRPQTNACDTDKSP